MNDLRSIAKKFEDKLKKIKVVLFDCDGILTDSKIYYHDEKIGFNRSFHAHDGYGMKLLMKHGLKVGVISGGDSVGVKKRLDYLKVDYQYLGNEDKREALKAVVKDAGCEFSEVLYMGDELFDIPLLEVVGFSATVPGAPIEVLEACDYTTYKNAGEACAREVIDILRYAQNIHPEIPRI